ncbi:hypothetical protein NC653_013250 [Populus alba x Populus x berolinensis]|uniref:Uncharacterized protein n=1 Tax=Populus alba x Populus x berolinensis TaxID=444605 RepID=A0AAD6W2S5_9ROSI|nr:hypothetical protein NC653_013250 [Populus alba x Populus x berolinensis]
MVLSRWIHRPLREHCIRIPQVNKQASAHCRSCSFKNKHNLTLLLFVHRLVLQCLRCKTKSVSR